MLPGERTQEDVARRGELHVHAGTSNVLRQAQASEVRMWMNAFVRKGSFSGASRV
jgi:hypothetical protein